MTQTIDVTGLPPEVIRSLQAQVDALRTPPPAPQGSGGPPPGDTAEAWIARMLAFAASRPRSDVIADDSRESMYEPSEYWPGPPPDETAESWVARLTAWAESHPKRDIVIDDDRGSIYDRSVANSGVAPPP
jgi:hypothetical protein